MVLFFFGKNLDFDGLCEDPAVVDGLAMLHGPWLHPYVPLRYVKNYQRVF
jgi:hypothetical protein